LRFNLRWAGAICLGLPWPTAPRGGTGIIRISALI
jgi:hypothetical protein